MPILSPDIEKTAKKGSMEHYDFCTDPFVN